MFTLFCIAVLFLIIHQRFGLSVVSLSLAMLFGALVGTFLGPAGAIAGAILWALLASGEKDTDT